MIVNIDAWICYSFKHWDHLPVFIKKPLGCLFCKYLTFLLKRNSVFFIIICNAITVSYQKYKFVRF